MAQAKLVRVVRGAVMDVAMSISSALSEVHAVAPERGWKDLVRSGMNIGRDMVGTMTNTLILAFLGSGLTLIIYLYSLGLDPHQLISSAISRRSRQQHRQQYRCHPRRPAHRRVHGADSGPEEKGVNEERKTGAPTGAPVLRCG